MIILFEEFLRHRGLQLSAHWELSPAKADVVRMMGEYFYTGGLSECFDIADKRAWHQSLYDKILLSDIVVRNHIRNERSLKLLVRKREIDAIKKTARFLQPKTVQIVTYNEEEVIEEDGIRVEVVPIFKWVMEG